MEHPLYICIGVIPDPLSKKSGFGCVLSVHLRYKNVPLSQPQGIRLGIVLPEQVTLPVSFMIWKHSGQADLLNILNALLQLFLQQLPLLLLLIHSRRRATILLDSGTGQRL